MKQLMFKQGWRQSLRLLATVLAGTTMVSHALAEDDDLMLVGDSGNNTVAAMNAGNGVFLGTYAFETDSQNYQLRGPRGMIFLEDSLLVVNQNVGVDVHGEVFKFDAQTGAFAGKLVSSDDPAGPWDPQSIIAGPEDTVYIADLGDFVPEHPGRVLRYDLKGRFLRDLDPSGFGAPFYPRGLVIGPDGLLYVSTVGNLLQGERATGYVLRFKYHMKSGEFRFYDTFIASTAANNYSGGPQRPQGLVFGSDGRLYVTSFLTSVQDASGHVTRVDQDAILVFDKAGRKLKEIQLEAPGAARAYAQALLFGPQGDLFVPITSATEVRRYHARSGFADYTPLLGGGSVLSPWYVTFRETNPATLAYEN